MTQVRTLITDLSERALSTFVQVFLAQLALSGFFSVEGVVDLALVQKAGLAGVAAVLSLVKGIIATRVGVESSASLAPAVQAPGAAAAGGPGAAGGSRDGDLFDFLDDRDKGVF